jgi:KTSC domain
MPSQAIRGFTYDAARNELTVTFSSGRGYVYALVPAAVFAAFAEAASKGAFLNAHIRDRYPFRKAPAAGLTAPVLGDALEASVRG